MVLADSHRISPVPRYSGYWLADFLTYTGLSPSMVKFSKLVLFRTSVHIPVLQPPNTKALRFGLIRVRSPLLAESLLFSLPPGTEMFQFPGLPPLSRRMVFNHAGFPIRTSTDQNLFAAPRSLSQLITSFVVFESLGIPHTLLFAS
jgi:hypothetical protein